MGACISKCNPKKTSKKVHKNELKNQEECNCNCIKQNNSTIVQDKVVISQLPISCTKSPINSSPPRTNSNYPTTSSSSSSSSFLSSATSFTSASTTSTVSSKLNRSFANDYLGSFTKEKPQTIRPNYLPKGSNLRTKCHINGNYLNGPKQQIVQSSPQRVVRPIAQKRPRSNSPSNLTRQKSFRRESESKLEPEFNKPASISSRYSRPISPSSSKRFIRETSISHSRNYTNSMRRDNCYIRPPSPRRINGNSRRYGGSNNNLTLKNEDYCVKMVNSKIKELAIGGLSTQDMDMMPIEDEQNPHIALDCFIFL